MDMKNYTQVLINGKIYTLGGSEDESYLQKTASYVNEKINAMEKLPGFTRQSEDYQTVMTLLNMADDYFKALEQADTLAAQKEALEKEAYSLKHELVSSQIKLESVLKELEDSQKLLGELAQGGMQQAGKTPERMAGAEEAESRSANSSYELAAKALAAARKATANSDRHGK